MNAFPRLAIAKLILLAIFIPSALNAQSVCLPAPRLLATNPMGGQVGTEVSITIRGQDIDGAKFLRFSHPSITAEPKLDQNGKKLPNQFVVNIGKDCPLGIHEANVMTRLGISSSRVFTVGDLPETTAPKSITSIDKSHPVEINSICNATMTVKAIDHYKFVAKKGQRVLIDCAAKGIDSKLKPVLIVAGSDGNDIRVQRRGGAIDFTAPEDDDYIIKVHDLTFKGGADYFYRLAITELDVAEEITRLPSTQNVNAFSWPPQDLGKNPAAESEPNNTHSTAQKISLPCDITGSFFPAADVDRFEFNAKKGEVWWIEVASERLGLNTDPSVIVQQVTVEESGKEKLTDVAELSDIPSPVKVSSNNYAYDGPPYNAGSSDVLGKIEIKQDGKYRIQLSDLFGGTRNEPQNVYRLIVRKAQPDFSIVGWAMHMMLRNGDRNALSKPIALRRGATMALEVVAVRRDGFDGPIELNMENLPEGVTATGLTIPAKQTKGMMLISASPDAPAHFTSAKLIANGKINDKPVQRSGFLASMAWPVKDAWQEIPAPRLLNEILISVTDSEPATLAISPQQDRVFEAKANSKLTIPLSIRRNINFSGANLDAKTLGGPFERNQKFNIPINAKQSNAVIDLARCKPQPGEYVVAFYGSAVAKYESGSNAVLLAEEKQKRCKKKSNELAAEVRRLTAAVKTADPEEKKKLQKQFLAVQSQVKSARLALTNSTKALNAAKRAAAPKDIADIIVSKPIRIKVVPAK